MDTLVSNAVREEDHAYIISVYVSIMNRLCKWVPETSKQRLRDQFDVEFFAQLLTTRQFGWTSLHGLANTTFQWIHDLQMPVRDTSTEEAKQRVLTVSSFPEAIGMYVKEVDKTLTLMEQDMKEFVDNRDHPVVQTLLRNALKRCQ
jgi:predicted DNA-binding protein YlxM (UPF0122 family)